MFNNLNRKILDQCKVWSFSCLQVLVMKHQSFNAIQIPLVAIKHTSLRKLRKTLELKSSSLLFCADFSSLEIYLATNMGQR